MTISKVIDNNFFIIILGNKTRLGCYIWLTSSCFFNVMIMIVMMIIKLYIMKLYIMVSMIVIIIFGMVQTSVSDLSGKERY